MGTCITKSIKQYNNIKFKHDSIIQKGKAKGNYKDLKWFLSAFLNLKMFFVPDFGGQEIPYLEVRASGSLRRSLFRVLLGP